MKIEVYHKGQLFSTVTFQLERKPFTDEAHQDRQLVINHHVKRVRHHLEKTMGEAGAAAQLYVVAASSMNHYNWQNLPQFAGVAEYLQEHGIDTTSRRKKAAAALAEQVNHPVPDL